MYFGWKKSPIEANCFIVRWARNFFSVTTIDVEIWWLRHVAIVSAGTIISLVNVHKRKEKKRIYCKTGQCCAFLNSMNSNIHLYDKFYRIVTYNYNIVILLYVSSIKQYVLINIYQMNFLFESVTSLLEKEL